MNIKYFSLILIAILFLGSCSASKKAEKNVKSGNYDQAFDIGFSELSKDKGNFKIVKTFKQAYDKANERDLKQISMYKSQNNPLNLKKIYGLYEQLDSRQYQVISLQPLYIEEREVFFEIMDYSNEIYSSKKDYSRYLYNTAQEKMKGTKLDARTAYKLFNELEYINPTFVNNLSDLIIDAKMKGSSLILMKLTNKISTMTTDDDIDELLRISESNMKNPWIIYHVNKESNLIYDYQLSILLDHLNIAPQQINSELIPQQARIVDGWEYILDASGNVMKDSLGNDMKRDRIITVQAELRIMQQLKSSKIDGTVSIKNLKTNSVMFSNPLFGEARFENVFGIFRGDQRAIEQKYFELLQKKEVPFPPDQEVVKYALGDFKSKILLIINNQQFQ